MAERPKGRICFTCTASDGREVTLFRDVYHGHVIRAAKPEIVRDYEFPTREIENALVKSDGSPQPTARGNRRMYRGPKVSPRPPKTGQERWLVVVQPDPKGDWVVAAYPVLVI